MDLIVARERLADCIGELVELGRQHHAELASADYEFHPDLAKFQAREDAGELRVFTMRSQSERIKAMHPLVGYTLLYVQPNPHGNETIAVEGLVYIAPAFRGNGLRLMRESDRLLAEEGVNRVFRTVCLTAERDHGLCLSRLGYAPKEQIWCRKLSAERQWAADALTMAKTNVEDYAKAMGSTVPELIKAQQHRQDAPDFVEANHG